MSRCRGRRGEEALLGSRSAANKVETSAGEAAESHNSSLPTIPESAHVSLCRSIIEGWDRLLSLGVRAAWRRARGTLLPRIALQRIITLTCEFLQTLRSPEHT